MRRVAGVSPLKVRLSTWVAAVTLASVCVLAALYVADRSAAYLADRSGPPHKQTAWRELKIAPEPRETPNRAKKEARETFRKQTLRTEPESAPPKPEIVTPMPEEDGEEQDAPAETGRASWYALQSATASGEAMDPDALTAAHRTLPLGTRVQVENLDNGRAVVVRINDRGPFAKNRIIDLSRAAAANIGMVEDGVATVRLSLVEDAVASNTEASAAAR